MIFKRIKHKKITALCLTAVMAVCPGAEVLASYPLNTGLYTADAADGSWSADSAYFTLSPSEIQYGEIGTNKDGSLDRLFSPNLVMDDRQLELYEEYNVEYRFFAGDEEINLQSVPAGTQVRVEAYAALTDAAKYTAPKDDISCHDTSGSVATCDGSDPAEPSAPVPGDISGAYTSAVFTVAKRKVVIRYTAPADDYVDGRDIPEDGFVKIPSADIEPGRLKVTCADGSTSSLLEEYSSHPEELLEGSLTLDLTDADVTESGYRIVPVEMTFTPEFEENFEVVGNICGDVYVKKAQYYATFIVNNSGKQWSVSYPLTSDVAQTAQEYSFYPSLQLGYQDFLVDSGNDADLVGWSVYTDGFNVSPESDTYLRPSSSNTTYLNKDASTYERSGVTQRFELSPDRDYLFVGHVSKAVAENIYVSAIPAVVYDGHAHVAQGTTTKAKTQTADLRLLVYRADSAMNIASEELTPGTDYVVTGYANNINASVKVSDSSDTKKGVYTPTWLVENDRPKVTISGKGTYKGFTADVYFDILPANLGATESSLYGISNRNSETDDAAAFTYPYTQTTSSKAKVTGLNHVYVLADDHLTVTPKPVVAKSYSTCSYNSAGKEFNKYSYSYKLVKDVDYKEELYVWSAQYSCWEAAADPDPNHISQTGDYLYVVRGIGNFCGAVYDGYDGGAEADSTKYNSFDDGRANRNPTPGHSIYATQQFCVTAGKQYDFSKIKVQISQKTLPFKLESDPEILKKLTDPSKPIPVKYTPADFKISVKNSEGKVMQLDRDYKVSFQNVYTHYTPDNADEDLLRSVGITHGSTVGAAGEYRVIISPAGNYLGNNKIAGTVKITGMKLKKNYFTLNKAQVNFGSDAEWVLTTTGRDAGISDDPYSPYYVHKNRADASYTGYDLLSSPKVTCKVGGKGCCGYGIDPSTAVSLTYKHTKMTLAEAVTDSAEDYLRFRFPTTVPYNVKGSLPKYITVLKATGASQTIYITGNKYTDTFPIYNRSGVLLGYEKLTFTFHNNKKLGETAYIKVKGSGLFAGTCVIGTYTIQPCVAEEITPLTPNISAYTANHLYVQFIDQQKGVYTKNKPTITLYQAYYASNGQLALATVKPKYYTVSKNESNTENASTILISSGASAGYVFGADGSGLETGVWGFYTGAKLPKIKSITIDGKEYAIVGKTIDGLEMNFTGTQRRPQITSITLADKEGTVLECDDYYLSYGTNIAAKTKGGTVTITTHYNDVADRYPYSGAITLKFDIIAGSKIKL